VYWKPVWHLLEEHFEPVLANAQHIKNVPGRKTDVNDAAWIADLLAHGLINASFVPPKPIQELRDLTRTRKQLMREVSQHSLRIQKTLEDANIKLGSVLSHVLGYSGRAILNALIAGETAIWREGTRARNAPSLSKPCMAASAPPITDACSSCTWGSSTRSNKLSRRWMPTWEKPWRRSNSAPACSRRCRG
jgi:hypothetical protein